MPVKVGAVFVPAGVKAAVPFVPAGVPALTALDVTEFPVKVGAVFVPVEVVACVWVPRALPVKTGAATDPDGVKLPVEFVPAGVTVSLPPVVPTSL